MQVTVKVGSVLTIPLGTTGFTVSAENPTMIGVTQTANRVSLTAKAAGASHLTLTLAADLTVTLLVNVVP